MSTKRKRTAGGTAKKNGHEHLFGGPVIWDHVSSILEVASDRTVSSVLHRTRDEAIGWIVVVRPQHGSDEVYYYAFRRSELEYLLAKSSERMEWPIEKAMDMHEWMSSRRSRGRRPIGLSSGQQGPAAARIVDQDASGRIVAIGEHMDSISGTGVTSGLLFESMLPEYDIDLGPMRSGRDLVPLANEVEVTLSAETRSEIDIGSTAQVPFQIELTQEAMPLQVSQSVRAKKDLPIIVSLSVENDVIEIVRRHEFTVDPPESGLPRNGFFTVRGIREGICRFAVSFHQGGSELGIIGLAVDVVSAGASKEKTSGVVVAAPRDIDDDDKLALLVELRVESNQAFYMYTLHSEALDLPYLHLRSKPLLDRGGGPAANALAFVERIYERITQELKSLNDLNRLQREARALGANLCQELFDPEVTKVLWPLRDQIKLVQIVSWEPYIPWELVRLRNPDSDEIDDRFLCEYGLVRTLSDETPSRTLQLQNWAYLGATFPMGTLRAVGAELDYFTTNSPESLHSHGIIPTKIEATRDAFYDALSEGNFDVLHISCHAEASHSSIERASLIIGDEMVPGDTNARLVDVDTITVEAETHLKKRRPLVFLNACETGRVGAVLTAWGGWPNVFLRKGAGAFIGTSWAVRDKPAAKFSTIFYNALLDGKTLSEAASAARAEAKNMGDASWLAFKVYGHPRAKHSNM